MREYLSAPILADISITNKCNFRCDYCYASSGEYCIDSNEMTLEELDKVFFDLNSVGLHRISLTGGEPFLRKDFFEILDAAQKYDFAIIINSNGSLIDDAIAKKLSQYRFDRICITLDGSKPEIHEKCRGKGTFVKVLKGIRCLQKYNLPVSTLFTLTELNLNDLIDTIHLNELLGITYMSVMVMCPTGRGAKGDLLVKKADWYPIFLKLSEMKNKGEIKLNFKIVPPNESSVFWLFYFPLEYYGRLDLLSCWNQFDLEKDSCEASCQAGIKAVSIMCNGDVYGCDLMIGIDELKAGNIKKNSILDIWKKSEVFKKLRTIEKKNLQGQCKECQYTWCGGGCRSAAYNLDGNIYGSDKSCFYCGE